MRVDLFLLNHRRNIHFHFLAHVLSRKEEEGQSILTTFRDFHRVDAFNQDGVNDSLPFDEENPGTVIFEEETPEGDALIAAVFGGPIVRIKLLIKLAGKPDVHIDEREAGS